MERRTILFLIVSFAIVIGYTIMLQKMRPPVANNPPAAQNPQGAAKADKKDADKGKPQGEEKKPADGQAAEKPAANVEDEKEKTQAKEAKEDNAEKEKEKVPGEKKLDEKAAAVEAPPEPAIPEEWLTLGSVDPKGPYRIMATLTNRGAALARIELSNEKYRDIDVRSGYLGHILTNPATKTVGCPVQLVGPGTPAEKAGLEVGDLIIAAAGRTIKSPGDLKEALGHTKPNQTIELTVVRGDKTQKLTPTLTRYPMEVIRPPYPLEMMPPPLDGPLAMNADDPLSMLMTIDKIDDQSIPEDTDAVKAIEEREKDKKLTDSEKHELEEKINRENLDRELPGVRLRSGVWEIVKDKTNENQAVFKRVCLSSTWMFTKRTSWKRCRKLPRTMPTFKAIISPWG